MGSDSETGIAVEAAPAAGAETPKLRVFLSYSRKDGDFVARLAAALDGPKFEASYDASPHGATNPDRAIAAEDDWWKQLERMIAAADAMVFIVSPDSVASKVCDEEILYARTMGKRVIAVMRREIDFAKAPPRLAALNVKLRFLDDSEAGFAASLAALSEALELDAAWWREQTWLAGQVKTWRDADEDKRKDWLLSAAELERAERWAARRPPKAPQVSETELDFLAASRARQAELAEEEARKLKVRRRLQLGVLALTVVALVITIGGGIFVVDRQRGVARSESLVLANVARAQAEAGADASALRLSLVAARDSFLSPAMPEAESLLARTSAALQLEREFLARPGMTDNVAVSADGARIVSWSEYGAELTLWDVATGKAMATLALPVEGVDAPSISEAVFAGKAVIAWLEDVDLVGRYQLAAWQAATGAKGWERSASLFNTQPVVSGDKRLLVLAEKRLDADGGLMDGPDFVTVIDIATGRVVFEREINPDRVAISNDGKLLALWKDHTIEVLALPDGIQMNLITPQFRQEEGADDRQPSAVPADDTPEGLLFSPDGRRLVAWTAGYGVLGWDLDLHGGVRFVEKRSYRMSYDLSDPDRFEARVGGVAFAGDSDRVVMWSTAGISRFVTAYNDTPTFVRAVRSDQRGVATTPLLDGYGVMTVSSEDTAVRLWSFAKPDAPALQLQHAALVNDAIASADGTRVLTMGRSFSAGLWDAESGRRLRQMRHDDEMNGYAFVAGGRVLTWGRGGVMRLWRGGDGVLVQLPEGAVEEPQRQFVAGAAQFSRDGANVLVWDRDRMAIADTATGKVRFHEANSDQTYCVYWVRGDWRCGFDPVALPGRFVAWNGDQIRLTPAAGSQDMDVLSDGRRQGVAVVSPDGTRVLGYGEDGAKVWDLATGKSIHVAAGEEMMDAAFLGDGSRFVLRDRSWSLRIFATVSGAPLGATASLAPDSENALGHALIVSPDGKWALGNMTASRERPLIAIVDGAKPVPVKMPDQHGDAAFSPQSDVFATWGSGMLSIWRIDASGKPVPGEQMGSGGFMLAVRFSPDGKMFATVETEQVRLWRTGETKAFAVHHMNVAGGADFNADGTRLTAWDGTRAVIIDTQTGELLFASPEAPYEGVSGDTVSAVSPDGTRLLVSSITAGARLYDVSATRKPASISALREKVCGGRDAVTEDAGAAASYWRITEADVAAAPVLRDREGEDVCAWERQWYDVALDTLFGWVK